MTGRRFAGPAVELDDVSKTYGGAVAVRAIDQVTLRIDAGELLALVGASGSGKSTLLALMGGLDRADTGRVSIGGHDLSALGDGQRSAARARLIGFVFQQFHLLPTISAVENVALGLVYGAVPRAQRLHRAEQALERVGLAERQRHRPFQLSGGEQQRVAIARALIGSPAVLLADEPTGALDSASGENVMRLLSEIAAALPRRVRLSDGRVVADESGTR